MTSKGPPLTARIIQTRTCSAHALSVAEHQFVEQSMEQSLGKSRQLASAKTKRNHVDRAQIDPFRLVVVPAVASSNLVAHPDGSAANRHVLMRPPGSLDGVAWNKFASGGRRAVEAGVAGGFCLAATSVFKCAARGVRQGRGNGQAGGCGLKPHAASVGRDAFRRYWLRESDGGVLSPASFHQRRTSAIA